MISLSLNKIVSCLQQWISVSSAKFGIYSFPGNVHRVERCNLKKTGNQVRLFCFPNRFQTYPGLFIYILSGCLPTFDIISHLSAFIYQASFTISSTFLTTFILNINSGLSVQIPLFETFFVPFTMYACCHLLLMSDAFFLWLLYMKHILDHSLISKEKTLFSNSFLPLSFILKINFVL